MLRSLSLRGRLAVLVMAAILPLAALSVWFAMGSTQKAIREAQSQLKFSASLVAAHQDRMVESAQQMLAAVATMPGLRSAGVQRCASYFEGLRTLYPVYFDIGILDVEGRAVCHANQRSGSFAAGDRTYFKRALSERRLVMGHTDTGRSPGSLAIPFAQPIMEGDAVVAVAFASLDLGQAANALAGLDLPPGASVVVSDRHGQVLMELPLKEDGPGEFDDAAGQARIIASASSRQVNGEGFVAVVAIDRAQITQASLVKLRNELLLLAIALLAGVTAAWWIGGHAIEFARRNEQGGSDVERALRSSNQELEAFSYSVSHDLRAPLGAISGFGRALALKLEGHPDDRALHYLGRMQAGVEKMEQLIESLLSLAKVARAPLNYGSVDLSVMAREVVEGLRMHHPEREVSIQIQDGLQAHGDPRLLRVVLENLVGNAWKFTSRTQAARVEVGKLEDSGEFFVRDNGVGFDMAYADKLFGAFQRLHTESEFPGTGIGLATVRRIVARHQGRVWAESLLGQATTFFFVLSESAPPAWLAGDTS
jgi:signal transduction histidine kinase